MTNVALRAADPAEAAVLTELALRSKAHWGYDKEFLDACRAELTLTPQDVAGSRVTVAQSGAAVVGFYTIDGAPPEGELGNLWVDPGSIGRGIGRRLWTHAVGTARTAGFAALRIEADPHAEEFYLAMGARRIGERRSGSLAGRVLPLLHFAVSGNLVGGS